MTKFLTYYKTAIKYFVLCMIGLAVFSCANSNTLRPESSNEANFKPSPITNGEDPVMTRPVGQSNPPEIIYHEVEGNTTPSDSSADTPYKGDYILGPEDLLEINIYQVDELQRTVRVSASGYIKLPLAGEIYVSGLTASELEAEISKRLERYLQEPAVSVFIKDYRSQTITVLGAVKNPQVYTVSRQKFLLDILSIAGGLSNEAGDICYVRRGNETIIINIKDLLIGGDIRLNVPVFSGDIVHVPIGGVVFVDGSVNSPGSFSMRGTVTLTQVIAMARGLKFEAMRDEIRVYRDSGKETRDIIDVDYDAILDKKAPDIYLKDKDVVIVPKSGAKSLWNGFVQSINGAFRFGSSVSVGAGF